MGVRTMSILSCKLSLTFILLMLAIIIDMNNDMLIKNSRTFVSHFAYETQVLSEFHDFLIFAFPILRIQVSKNHSTTS